MRTILKRTVFGVPLGTLLLAIFTVSALAWAVYIAFTLSSAATINVAPAPVAIAYTMDGESCTVSGSGSVSSVVLSDPALSCTFDDFEDDTQGYMKFVLTNDSAISIVATLTRDDAAPCAELIGDAGPFTIAPAASQNIGTQVNGVLGPAGTVTCGGTSIGPFSLTVDVAEAPWSLAGPTS